MGVVVGKWARGKIGCVQQSPFKSLETAFARDFASLETEAGTCSR